MKIIDLHMHSTVSDGTDTPAELLRHVRETGIDLFALTDHDAIKGYKMIRDVQTESDPKLLSGVEFSCRDKLGKYHILGYNYDPDGESIQAVVDLGHSYRMTKLMDRIDYLKVNFGFSFSDEDIDALKALDNPGKPHIANLMVKYGYVPTKEVGIKDYLNQVHTPNKYVLPEEAIHGILASGGIPVLAHPSYGSGEEIVVGTEMDERLKRLIGFGLQGVEAFYSTFPPRLIEETLSFAKKYDLYITAGSDYHGKNKLIPLAETNLDLSSEIPDGMKRFFERIHYKP